ncbi:MAG: hypothetical protein QHJ82_00115 [Verrucomicrobiota bacterium]|nr:hypothetical protein [Verrucomicrobiota bacterium]
MTCPVRCIIRMFTFTGIAIHIGASVFIIVRKHWARAIGTGDWDWRLADVGFRELLARKGLARWAVIVLFAGLPLAGLQLAIWLLGSDRVHNWPLENGPDALTRFVR